ncbi:tumor necrosis factor receptor superfamily member 1A isoform X3 [Lates calcarifer]|uniref:Tumor necrosis factor receptor superfamily member 1A isoform X1 n=1 Tax=Lates calcarifer TaxID=8187 RepID=A0A4W6G819_LATCA|nr:tumor necrosis factor receptor superfamily member 1A isoform X1 [Lates calcarifer]XP_050927116.1 tumor necrosis factor receptor superfamily member 1A isoform X2 [Lates calcarifer]XP_050927117.1 tumor necrosis factor receptor superfamily member 1A isoform X3 [Lates calcarifer]
MDLVLVLPLILAFISSGQSHTEVTEQATNLCYKLCPAGYYKIGTCDDPVAKYKCKRCETNTFTAIENFLERCLRCETCNHDEIVKTPCSTSSDVVCDCKEGYYYGGSNSSPKFCKPCKCQNCNEPIDNDDYKKKCLPCQREDCLNDSECKRKCTSTTAPLSTTTTSTTTSGKYMSASATSTTTTSANETYLIKDPITPPSTDLTRWLFGWVVVLIFVLFFGLPLLITRRYLGNPNSFPCWSTDKGVELHVEDPKLYEQHSHQGSSPTTLTLHISEETPMMVLSHSPATPQHPALVSPLLPNAEHKAARRNEQSERWPAIVLYAIIKEVPLRRWKEFLRLLLVTDQQMERVELEAGLGLGSMETQYQMLRLWSQRSSASLDDIFSALHYMDLSGCAQLLQESLEKLHWGPEQRQGLASCRSNTDCGLSGALQET